jgi:hypothetical protein
MILPAMSSLLVHHNCVASRRGTQLRRRKEHFVQTRYSRLERCRLWKNEFIRLSWICPSYIVVFKRRQRLDFVSNPPLRPQFWAADGLIHQLRATHAWARIRLVPIIQAVGSVAKPGGWENPQDKGEKSEEENGMEEEEHT